jgi:hypothetical protein
LTGVTLIVLIGRSDAGFAVVKDMLNNTQTPKGTYAVLFFGMALWGSALGSAFAD